MGGGAANSVGIEEFSRMLRLSVTRTVPAELGGWSPPTDHGEHELVSLNEKVLGFLAFDWNSLDPGQQVWMLLNF